MIHFIYHFIIEFDLERNCAEGMGRCTFFFGGGGGVGGVGVLIIGSLWRL